MEEELRCLEWFSGIGGLHYGLLEAQEIIQKNSRHHNSAHTDGAILPKVSVVAAFDINELANRTYEYNFHKAPITVRKYLLKMKYIFIILHRKISNTLP